MKRVLGVLSLIVVTGLLVWALTSEIHVYWKVLSFAGWLSSIGVINEVCDESPTYDDLRP